VYNFWGDEMEEDKRVKVDCELVTRGTAEAESGANDDLAVPDPEPAVGKQIIEEASQEDEEDGDKSGTSE